MTPSSPNPRPGTTATSLAAHDATCDTAGLARHVAELLTGPEPLLLDLSNGPGATITLAVHLYEGDRPWLPTDRTR